MRAMAAIDVLPTPEPWIPEDSFRARLGVLRVVLGGLNIKQAAMLCGISPENWRRWEAGSGPRNLEEVARTISKATGVDYRWLIGGGPLRDQNRKFLTSLPAIIGQGSLLDDDLVPVEFYSRPFLAAV